MRYLFLFILLVLVRFSFAGNEIYSERIEKAEIDVLEEIDVYDSRYFEMDIDPLWPALYTNKRVTNKVQLGYIFDDYPTSDQSTTVQVQIERWVYVNNSFVLTTEIRDLQLNYYANIYSVVDDKSTFVFDDAHRVRVTILSVQGPVNHVYLESSVDVERYYEMNTSPIVNYGVNYLNYFNSASGLVPVIDPVDATLKPELEFWWDEVSGAEEYELEWVFINNRGIDNTTFAVIESPATELEFDFYSNSTRVQIKDNHYKIPGIFNQGYLVYRVRPIGRQGNDFQYRLEGNWSFVDASTIDDFDVNSNLGAIKFAVDYEEGKNWSHSTSYAENGKRFESITYFDGIGRARQSITHNTVTEQVVVNNAYFDKAGRPVISHLPTPVDGESMSFRENFNYLVLSNNGTPTEVPFTLENYLLENDDCELPNPMSQNRGTGWYYSANNLNQDGANAYIPNANGYPFNKVIYKNDPTGRVQEVGGFGLDLQTSEHGTKMFYVTPSQDELNRLFGTDVGLNEHYQKSTTVDANGQAYIQYTDLAGRVIATALSGSSPANLETLENNTGPVIETNEIYTNSQDINTDPLIASYTYYPDYISDPQELVLSHDFDPAVFEDAQCINGICFDCHYTFKIRVDKIDCSPITTVYDYSNDINGFVINQVCNNLPYDGGSNHILNLDAGQYVITKELKVNSELAEDYWCEYIDNADLSNPDCAPSFVSIYNTYYDNADFDCEPGSPVVTASYTYCDFKRKQLMSDLFIGGQYGEVLDASGAINPGVHPLSIYNSSNQLPSGNDWKSPTGDYLDASGNVALIPIISLGNNTFSPQIDPSAIIITIAGVQYVHPEDLALVSDFIQYAELSWMDALVENHPEYCYLQFCEQNSGNYHAFSSEFENTFTFDEACANGMFTPLGVTSLPSVLTSCAIAPSMTDNFFTTGYFSGNIALWAAENYDCVPIISNTSIVGQSTTYSSSLNNYYQVEENGIITGQLSIWQYAVWQAICPNETTYTSIISCVNNATLDDCNKELIWQYFKLAYQDIRERTFLFAQTAYVSFPAHLMGGSNCSLSNNACFSFENWKLFDDLTAANAFGCLNVEVHYDATGLDQTAGNPTVLNPDPDDIGAGPCSHLTALLYADKTPNFLNFYEPNYTLPPGVDLTTTSGQQAFMASQVETICQDYCASQADLWMLSIDGCLSQSSGLPWDATNPTYVNIRNGLIEVCAAGCDASNIYGTSTLPQGVVTASGFNSFQSVLEYYLPGYSGYGNADCSHLLISSPAPLGANPNQIINQPLDDCACDKVLQAKLDFSTNTNPSITSIAEMLAYNEGVNLSTAASLACACEQEYVTSHGTNWTSGANWIPASVSNLTSSNILVPEELTCGFTERCSDCAEINALYASFIGIFGSGITLHPNYEVLLENYMNFSLGYNLNGDSYEAFIESCNSTTNDPSCATTQLTPVFLDLFDVIIRRGQLLEVNLDLTDNIVFANSSISTIFGGSTYSGVQNGSSLTSTFGNQVVTFTLPQGADFDFSDILTVSNFLAVPCALNDQFTLVAAIMKCGEIEYRTIEGSTNDFNFVNCYCGNSGQEICDNPQSIFISDDCYKEELIAINALSMSEYLSALENKKYEFVTSYKAQCAAAFETETIIETKEWNNYQFTLFYYDQAGNLIQTVAPEGVDLGFKSSATYATVNSDRVLEIANIPNHSFKTVYEYNSYNQLVSTTNPDQDGNTKFWYDRYGRIIASQNPVQAPYQYSYSFYDEYGRPVEVGQANREIPGTVGNPGNPGYIMAQFTEAQIKQDDLGVWFRNWINNCVKTEVTLTNYDDYSDVSVATKFKQTPISKNLRLRVAQVRYYPSLNSQTNLNTEFESAVYYNYDQHGNVTEQVQDIPMMAVVQQDLKSTQYEFELISGNVSKVRYQADEKDQFTHEYHYDKLNRLTEVFSSSDGVHKVREAHYYYYDYGPLARTELGDHKVQGQDFAYTINGWLKVLNGSTLDPTQEMGKDAYSGFLATNTSIHKGVARDVNAYTIGYFEGDYSAISGNSIELATLGTPFADQGKDLFNGNIRHVVTSIYGMSTLGSAYKYDQLNRLKEMNAFELNTNWESSLGTDDYFNSYSYDQNGNITDLQRNGTATTSSLLMDQFNYSYGTVAGQLSNRLNYVTDTGADDATSVEGDIKSGQQANNYQYDALGQLTKDIQEGITSIVWRKGDKKLKAMTQNDNSPNLEFFYNPFGVRIAKVEKTKTNGVLNSQDQWKWTYYSYDANGQCMAVYDINKSATYNKASLSEQHLYGSSRLGMVQNYKLLYNNGSQLPSESIVKQHELGERRYELTNHLGNVQAVITDRKTKESELIVENSTFSTGTDGWLPFGQSTLTWNQGNGSIDITAPLLSSNGTYKTFNNMVVGATYTVTIQSNQGNSPGLELFLNGIGTYPLNNGTQSGSAATTVITFTAQSNSTEFIIRPNNANATYIYSVNGVNISLPTDYYQAVVVMTSDYYPFGMAMPQRQNTNITASESYRYAYNGMEQDNEISGNGNSYTTEFRQYDPRLGRWKSLDPVFDPTSSPFNGFDNNPIKYNDPKGLYTEKRAERMARRAEKNGYDAKVVQSGDGKRDYGVHYHKRNESNTGSYAKTQFEGKFRGIGKSGLTMDSETEKYPELPDGTVLYDNMDEAAMAFAKQYGPNSTEPGPDSRSSQEYAANIFYVGQGKFALGNVVTDDKKSEVVASESRLGRHTDIRGTVHTHPGEFEEKRFPSEPVRWMRPDLQSKPSDFLSAKHYLWENYPNDQGLAFKYQIDVYVVNAFNEVIVYKPPMITHISIYYSEKYDDIMSGGLPNWKCEEMKIIGVYGLDY